MSRGAQREFSAWNHWYRRALPIYWVFLFVSTHLPKLQLPVGGGSDRYAHFAAYAILTFLFWRFVEAVRRPLPRRFALCAALILLGYAAFDELTQELVNRTADILDWACDAAAIIAVLLFLEWRRRVG